MGSGMNRAQWSEDIVEGRTYRGGVTKGLEGTVQEAILKLRFLEEPQFPQKLIKEKW